MVCIFGFLGILYLINTTKIADAVCKGVADVYYSALYHCVGECGHDVIRNF